MKLLTDAELQPRIETLSSPLVTEISTKDWQSKDSPIQPCSVDLHIGRIQIPSETGREPVRTFSASGDDYSLATGQTAVLTTIETLNMPSNIAGIGFPPSSVSIKGLLMTNPGHIDPGYSGPMHFTVINMARVSYPLRVGDRICTALFFELDSNVQASYRARRGLSADAPSSAVPLAGLREEEVNRLARDFVDVEKRAKDIALDVVMKSEDAANKAQWISGILTAAISVVLAAAITVGSQLLPLYLGNIEELKRNLAVESKEVEYLEERVADLEKKETATPLLTPQTQKRQKVVNPSGQ